MTLDGARVYFEGVNATQDYDDKIRQIVTTVKSLSPSSEVSMRFLKNGNCFEGLLWGQASEIPIGFYNRGQSMAHVLDALYKKVKKQSLKASKMKDASKSNEKRYVHSHEPMAMTG